MSLSGRRPSPRLRSLGRNLLDGLSEIGTALSDGPAWQRISEIDAEITELRQERDHLIASLVDPCGMEVSSDYNPNWTKREPVVEGGRLVQCEGREHSGVYHRAHPACPYISTIHNKHDFVLRD